MTKDEAQRHLKVINSIRTFYEAVKIEKDKHGHSALPNHGRAFVSCLISFFVLACRKAAGK
jgi:hypothetical protein